MANGVHPFREAWARRDPAAWGEALAPDVVARSPILVAPFAGRDAVVELYGVLFRAFGEVEITHELGGGDTTAFFWRGELDGRWIEGTDLIRTDERGRVAEVTVFIRPLVDIAAFAAAVGPHFARTRGPLRGTVARLTGPPLELIMRLVDALATWVVLRR